MTDVGNNATEEDRDPTTRGLWELEEVRRVKRTMLDDAASANSIRKGDTAKSKAAQLRLLETELSRASAQRDLVRGVALTAEARHRAEEDKATELEARCKASEASLVDLEAWMDSQQLSRSAQPHHKQTELAMLSRQAQAARAAATTQRALANREREVFRHATSEANRAERDFHASAEIREELSRERVEREAAMISAAKKKVAIEASVASKMERHHRARATAQDQARRDLRNKANAQLKAAKAAREAAAERANLLVRDAEPALKEVMRMQEEAHAQRVEAVLQLKADTEAAAAVIRGSNERRAAEKAREEVDHEAEKEQLTAKGLNPYKVFKQREVDRRAVREERKQEKAIRDRKEDLAKRLQNEEQLRVKQDAKERMDKEHEQRFRKELGKHVTDARNREYLRSRTVDGTDILDPSGRSFRVQPSQVTKIKDAAFGLGYHPRKTPAMASAVVDLVASKPRHAGVGTGEFTRLVPRDPIDGTQTTSKPSVAVADMASGGAGADDNTAGGTRSLSTAATPGVQVLDELLPPAGKENLPGTGVEFVEAGDGGGTVMGEHRRDAPGWEGGREGVGGGAREMSLFERQALEKARARQKNRLHSGQPQVAAGRVFQDKPAFVSKPDRVVFKDFTVGKVHKRRVVLTNVSLTFNTFRVLDMPDEISRFFEVSYSKPGRLSAGMTCAVDITFTPKVNEDIYTELPIRTQTGPLAVPVVCTARMVKPSLSTGLVVFQSTITGEKETAQVLVTNDGAIPSRFTIQNAPNHKTNATIAPAFRTQEYSEDIPTTSPGAMTTAPGDVITATPPTLDESKECSPSSSGPSPGEVLSDTQEAGHVGNGLPSTSSSPLPITEEDLFARTAAVGEAALKYPSGRGALEVDGGNGEVGAYGSAEILVTFAPLSVGNFRVVKVIRFEGSREEFELVVEASSAPVSVFPAETCTDLRCCVVGKLYVKKIRMCNRGKIAMKAIARVPPSLRDCASFSPDMGFVQPGSYFEFGLRFRPDEACLARCVRDGWGIRVPQKYYSQQEPSQEPSCQRERSEEISRQTSKKNSQDNRYSQDKGQNEPGLAGNDKGEERGGIIAVPITVDVPGQALPARLTLQSKITGWKVEVGCAGGDGDGDHAGAGAGISRRGDCIVRFGPCFVGQSVSSRLSLRNTSQLPTKFGFVGNPAEVTVQPADGFGVLLPGEQRWVEATFSPLSAVTHNSNLTFRTSLGQTTSIKCRGCGVEPVIDVSHTVINMAPACPGDTVTTSVFVTNISPVEQCLEFLAPDPALSFIKICPCVVHLQPGEGARIEIQFSPPATTSASAMVHEEANKINGEESQDPNITTGVPVAVATPSATTTPKKIPPADGPKDVAIISSSDRMTTNEARNAVTPRQQSGSPCESSLRVPFHAGTLEEGGVSSIDGEGVRDGAGELVRVDDGQGGWRRGLGDQFLRSCESGGGEREPWSRHGRWKVPCFLRRGERKGVVVGGSTMEKDLPPIALEMTTVTVARVLSVDPTSVDFGQLAVGSKAETTLRVRNSSDDDLPLEGGGLNPVGPFQVVNAFRPVCAEGGTHRCLLQFRPERAGIVSETLILTSSRIGKSIRIPVRGEGVSPVLRMEPEGGRLDMGHVLEGDTQERDVTLHNDSAFSMRYTTTPFGPRPPGNYNHIETFALVPCEGGVLPGESVTVKAIFSPDYSRIWPFLAAFKIEVQDQPDNGHVLRVRGRCLSRQMYVEAKPPGLNPGDQIAEATEDSLATIPPPPPDGATVIAGSATTAGLQAVAIAAPPILLRFPKAQEGGVGDGAGVGGETSPAMDKKMTFIVGCLTTNDAKKSGSGSFESEDTLDVLARHRWCVSQIELKAEAKEKGYFRIAPDKGTTMAGATVEVTCTFEPPPPPPRKTGPAGGKGGAKEVGQWYKTEALVHLRGGYRPPGSSELFAVKVQLEGFVTT